MFCAQRENKTILGNVLSPIENYNFTQWNDSGFMSASLKTSNRKSTPIIWFFFPIPQSKAIESYSDKYEIADIIVNAAVNST